MVSSQELADELEALLGQMTQAYAHTQLENQKLKHNLQKLKAELDESRAKIYELEDINQQMKVINAMQGSTEHRRMMKMKLNKLIREVDECIAEIKNAKL